jgi:hypothetical protein
MRLLTRLRDWWNREPTRLDAELAQERWQPGLQARPWNRW